MIRKFGGFTLIELLIVVAIVGIILGIAIPSYNSYVLRTRRTEAAKELMALAAAEERFNTNCNAYTASLTGPQATCGGLGLTRTTSENGYYNLSVVGTATTFTVTATPVGAQATDVKCMNLTLTNTGTKGVSGSGNAVKCWAGQSG